VHFLDAWLGLTPAHLLRSALPAGLIALAVLVPGRVVARLAALGVAVTLPFLPELAVPAWVATGWVALWLLIAWQVGLPARRAAGPGARLGGLESGTIGLVLGIALLALAEAGVARLDLDGDLTRRASGGVLLAVLGLVHLMLRRHAVRAAAAFAAMGLGLQLLDGAVRAAALGGAAPAGLPLLGTTLAVALALRVGHVRAAVAGSSWVGDAHDLHD
jgi:hypothetical protein